MEQMMEFLKAMEAKMETQVGSLASAMNAIEHKKKAHHKEMMAKMDAWQECAAAVGRPTRRTVPATCKGRLRKGPGMKCRRSFIKGRGKASGK
jgi:hypothetical protein